jgi:hypothetical protein
LDHPPTLAPRPDIHCHDTRIAWTSRCHVNHITSHCIPVTPQLHHIDPCLKGPFLSQLGPEHPPGEWPVSSRRVCLYIHTCTHSVQAPATPAQAIPCSCSCHVMTCHGLGPSNSSPAPLREVLRLPRPPSLDLQTLHGFGESQTQKTDRLTARPGS